MGAAYKLKRQMALLVSLLCGSAGKGSRAHISQIGGRRRKIRRSGRSRSQFVRGLTCNWAEGRDTGDIGFCDILEFVTVLPIPLIIM